MLVRISQSFSRRDFVREEEERGRVNYEREELVGSDLEDDEFEGSEYEDSEIEEYGSKDDNEDDAMRIEARVDDGDGSDYEDLNTQVDNEPLEECRGSRKVCGPSWKDFFMVDLF